LISVNVIWIKVAIMAPTIAHCRAGSRAERRGRKLSHFCLGAAWTGQWPGVRMPCGRRLRP